MYQINFSILNDTDYHLYMPSETNADGTNPDLVFDPPSTLGPGSELPPRAISPKTPKPDPTKGAPKNQCDFVVCSPATPIAPATSVPAPSGSLRLVLAGVNHEINLEWRDFSKWTVKRGSADEADGTVTPLGKDETPPAGQTAVSYVEGSPISLTWRRLDNATGELDVAFTTRLYEKKFVINPTPPISTITTTMLDVRVIVKVKGGSPKTDAPPLGATVMPAVSVRPSGSGKVVAAKTFHRWNDPELTAKRRLVLAYLGCILPLEYQSDVISNDKRIEDIKKILLAFSKRTLSANPTVVELGLHNAVAPLRGAADSFFHPISLTGWSPGGTSTSCVSLNTTMEGKLTGGAGHWAFEQYKLEEAWVPCGVHPVKKKPNVGDPYLMFRDTPDGKNIIPHTVHVGFILHVPENKGERWVTADAGQFPMGSTGFLNLKKWESRVPAQAKERQRRRESPDKPTEMSAKDLKNQSDWQMFMNNLPFANPVENTDYIYMAGGAESDPDKLEDANRLLGWLDLDMIPFKSLDLLDPITEWKPGEQEGSKGLTFHRWSGGTEIHPTINDYWFLGAWIDEVLRLANLTTTDGPTKIQDWIAHFNDPAKHGPPTVPSLEPKTPPVPSV